MTLYPGARRRFPLLSAAVLLALHAGSALAAADPELAAQVRELTQRVKELEQVLARVSAQPTIAAAALPTTTAVDQRVRALERKLEVAAEENAASKAKNPTVAVGEKGLSITSSDGNFEARLRGYVQLDSRFFSGDKTLTGSSATIDTFLARRVRPIFEGTVYKDFYYKVMPDFAGSAVSLQDAYAEWRRLPFAKVSMGKFKEPLGLERLASGSELTFVERGLTNNLVPNRDVGVQLTGEVLGGKLAYQVGVFNGVPDLGSVGVSDTNNAKDFVGRVFAQPFLDVYGPLQGLGVGLAGSHGEELGTAANTGLGSYVTPGQAKFFSYRTSKTTFVITDPKTKKSTTVTTSPSTDTTVIADGQRSRYSPQGYWYWRQFGVFGDYVESSQEVVLNSSRGHLTNSAWQIASSIVLTGEDASFRGVKPKANFSPGAGQWGAVELVGRYGELEIDQDAFAGGFADLTKSASAAQSWGLGVNWYLNRNFKVNLDYDETAFNGGGGGTVLVPLDRATERVVLSRVQITY